MFILNPIIRFLEKSLDISLSAHFSTSIVFLRMIPSIGYFFTMAKKKKMRDKIIKVPTKFKLNTFLKLLSLKMNTKYQYLIMPHSDDEI